jgi:hypothetical protein
MSWRDNVSSVVRAYPYAVTGAICICVGVVLGGIAVRVADGSAVDWPVTATAIKDVATTIGILGAGAWAAFLADRRRSLSTRAQLIHRYLRWTRAEEQVLRVYVELRNIGETKITPGQAWTYVQIPPQGPLTTKPAEDCWPDAVRVVHPMQEEEVYLEPGETEDYSFDFSIPAGARFLQLHTYIECDVRPPDAVQGSSTDERFVETNYNHWDLTTLIDLEVKPQGDDSSPVAKPAVNIGKTSFFGTSANT